jgi:hypothetical protein
MARTLPKPAGLILTALLSLAVLSVFYGNLLNKLNRVCFANGGDGMQSYINMDYHIRVDSSYMRCNSMNYPYGEHVFFTNNQPLISNTIKFISHNIIDISDYTLGILNFMMLFCLVITPLIIYLILTGVGVGRLVSSLASVGITYLSPQIDRFGGHFNLSYVCAIPLMIYLLMRFFRKPGFSLSILIFLTVMAGALSHFYFYGFFGVLILFFYGAYLAGNEKIFPNKYLWAVHLFLQLILPFLILQAFYITDHVTDRPGYPWGFLYYRAYPQSIFLPLNKPYGQFLHAFVKTGFIDWEGYAFVGMLAVGGTLVFLIKYTRLAFGGRFKEIFRVTSHRQLNILFWASLILLLYSFGLPFILGLERLIDLIGPVRQMRGIARFSWLFFYVMNIITIYWLWENWKLTVRKKGAALLIILGLVVLGYDAYYQVRNRGKWLENNIPALVDRKLTSPENQWIKRIDTKEFQAIIPLPYFHVGSENIWIDGACDIVTDNFIAIDRSGLPSVGVMLSRTSINQTVDNVAMMLEPSRSSTDMSRFPSRKPFLLMVARCDRLNTAEKMLVSHSFRIDSTEKFDLYRAPVNVFRNIYDSLCRKTLQEYTTLPLSDQQNSRSTDSVLNFIFVPYDNITSLSAYSGSGCYSGKAGDMNVVYSGTIPYGDTSSYYTASFWLKNIRTDLYPRTQVIVKQTDSIGNEVTEDAFQAFRRFVMIDGDWALVEWKFKLAKQATRLTIILTNETLRNKVLSIDNLMIRPEHTSIYMHLQGALLKNNRVYMDSE